MWLWRELPKNTDERYIRAAFTDNLNALAMQSRSLIEAHPLPDDIPEMLRAALEQKRAIGSESTFVCGRIDLPGNEYPDGRITL